MKISEPRRAAILDSLPANVAVIDRSGTIVFVNRPWRKFGQDNGFTGSDACRGENYLAICDAATGDRGTEATEVAAAIRAILARRLDRFEIEYPCHSPAEQRWFRCLIAGIIGGAVIMHLNITEKKLAELESLRAHALMAQLIEQKSSFVANLSHELRTPLNAIIGFSEMMMTRALGPMPARYAEYARDIHFSGVHLLEVINDLLDLSKIEAGYLALDKEAVALGTVVARAFRFLEKEAAGKKLDLSWKVADDLVLLADELRLRQILLNLLSNAVKFTPEGGRISLESGRAENGDIRFAIVDTGIGMTRAEIEIAMKPFGQVINAGPRQQVGTGLGLPLAVQLIELHGGTLSIASEPGRGSRFEVTLPAYREA